MNPPLPPTNLANRMLPIVAVSGIQNWYRIYRNDFRNSAAKYFGRSGKNRFDALKRNFGVIYLADSIYCSFAEIWLRYPHPTVSTIIIDSHELAMRSLASFSIKRPLRLVDLRGAGLARLGLDASIVATRSYRITNAWSSALHDHPDKPDGILYASRLNMASKCVAIFERAAHKIDILSDDRLDSSKAARLIAPALNKSGVGLV